MLCVWENLKTDSYKFATFDAKNYIGLIISTDEMHF